MEVGIFLNILSIFFINLVHFCNMFLVDIGIWELR